MIRKLRLEEQLRGGNEEGKFKEAPAGDPGSNCLRLRPEPGNR